MLGGRSCHVDSAALQDGPIRDKPLWSLGALLLRKKKLHRLFTFDFSNTGLSMMMSQC